MAAIFDPNKKEHLVNLQGRNYITFVGLQARLVDQQKAIVGTETEIVTLPDADNKKRAVVKCKMTIVKGDTKAEIECVGDADETNVSKNLAPATLRMAETRAQARCLRIATRAEYTAPEEIPQGV